MPRLALIIALFLLTPAVYFFYDYSRDAVIDELVAASQKNDVTVFAARVDWEALRGFLKNDLAAQKRSPLGSSFGPDLSQIDKVVDYYVQPENIDIAFYYHEDVFTGIPERDFIVAEGFAPPFGFSMTLGFPKSVDAKEIPAAKDRLKARFVFRLDGLTWKIKEMHVPIFMVPRHVYSTPAVKVYGRTQK